jgi:hypothetical protein
MESGAGIAWTGARARLWRGHSASIDGMLPGLECHRRKAREWTFLGVWIALVDVAE